MIHRTLRDSARRVAARTRPPKMLALAAVLALSLVAAASRPAIAGQFKTQRPVRVVVLGGSISMYYKGNYGQFLEYGCKNIEVINRAKVGAGGPALVKRLQTEILGNKALMGELKAAKEFWLLFQGGLNSVWSPWMTNFHLAKMFAAAKGAGFRTFALSLTPWGDDSDKRFRGWEGVWTHRATRKINAYLLGKLQPDAALGRYGKDRPHEWMKGEVPDQAVDLWDIGLRDKDAKLRDKAALEASFAKSRFRKEPKNKAKLVEEARAVPRNYLDKRYRDFDHIHPNSEGHKMMALAACRRAPASWGCDCKRLEKAVWKGKVVEGK